MKKAYKTEILLSLEQRQKVHQTIGVCRYVYNLYLSTAQNHYKETGKHLSGYDFSKWLNDHINELPVPKEQIQEILKERTW